MVRKQQRDWQCPTRAQKERNNHKMKQIHKAINVLRNLDRDNSDNEHADGSEHELE